MKNYTYTLGGGIHRSPEFQKKGLAEYAVNVGLRCGHDCTYCSSRAMLRCHAAFKDLGKQSLRHWLLHCGSQHRGQGGRRRQAATGRGLVQVCTTVDAWAPEAQELDLGRRCLEAILPNPAGP